MYLILIRYAEIKLRLLLTFQEKKCSFFRTLLPPFLSSLYIQTSSEVHPASHPMGNGGPFPRGKARLGPDADHLPASGAEVKND
jgi:hypothetical protein